MVPELKESFVMSQLSLIAFSGIRKISAGIEPRLAYSQTNALSNELWRVFTQAPQCVRTDRRKPMCFRISVIQNRSLLHNRWMLQHRRERRIKAVIWSRVRVGPVRSRWMSRQHRRLSVRRLEMELADKVKERRTVVFI